MPDLPLAVLTGTIWTYWFTVGAMVVRLRRRTRKLVGVMPEQRTERMMWLVWVPLVAAWCALPCVALQRGAPPLGLPAFARELPVYAMLRWVAAAIAVASLLATFRCWARMGKDWRMDASEANKANLITDGMFRMIRHPIYSFSMLLMLCSAAILPTAPMLVVAAVHLALMNLKARNEERHLLRLHGDAYRGYLARTGRFLPRFGATAR